jgi:hypothetical protein
MHPSVSPSRSVFRKLMIAVKCKYQSLSFYESEIAKMLIFLWLAWGRIGVACLFFPPYEKYSCYDNSEYVCIATVTTVMRPAPCCDFKSRRRLLVNIHCEQQRLFITQGRIVSYMRHFVSKIFFMAWQPQVGQSHFICRDFTIALNHISLGRTPLGEWSARRRDLLTDKRQTSMIPARF